MDTDIDTILIVTEERMEKAITTLEKEFTKLRTGRASISLVDEIKVDYYGTLTPINQLASITVPDSSSLAIQPWDKGAFNVIEKAILTSNLGLTPINDGKVIRIVLPPLTEERRKNIVKIVRSYSEDHKIAIRNIRRDANEQLKKLEKNKDISEDELKKTTDTIQKMTDKYILQIEERSKHKEKEIMEF